jgi:hypothetical protein
MYVYFTITLVSNFYSLICVNILFLNENLYFKPPFNFDAQKLHLTFLESTWSRKGSTDTKSLNTK